MIRSRVHEMVRFGIIGVTATLVHFITMNLLVEFGMDPVLANVVGFLSAIGISYVGQSVWVFKQPVTDAERMWKFGVSATLGTAANALIMALFVNILEAHHNIGFAVALIVVPLSMYILNKYWVFRAVRMTSLVVSDSDR